MSTYDLIHTLIESKQVGILYHYTTFEHLMDIIFDNELKGIYYNAVSFTRRNDLHKINWSISSIVRLVIDGDKLSNSYKIEPVQRTSSRFEAEERVNSSIKNIMNYLIEINLLGYTAEDFAEDMKQYNIENYYENFNNYYSKHLGGNYLDKNGLNFEAIYNDFVTKYQNIIHG